MDTSSTEPMFKEELCRCGQILKSHCEAFEEKIWYGCLKVIKGEEVKKPKK